MPACVRQADFCGAGFQPADTLSSVSGRLKDGLQPEWLTHENRENALNVSGCGFELGSGDRNDALSLHETQNTVYRVFERRIPLSPD